MVTKKYLASIFLPCALLMLNFCSQNSPTQSSLPKKGDLVLAVANGDAQKINALLKEGSDINEDVGQGGRALTPLLAAIAIGREVIASQLVEAGASPAPVYDGYNALEFAKANKFTNVIYKINSKSGRK